MLLLLIMLLLLMLLIMDAACYDAVGDAAAVVTSDSIDGLLSV